jgi:hypothetical protein
MLPSALVLRIPLSREARDKEDPRGTIWHRNSCITAIQENGNGGRGRNHIWNSDEKTITCSFSKFINPQDKHLDTSELDY